MCKEISRKPREAWMAYDVALVEMSAVRVIGCDVSLVARQCDQVMLPDAWIFGPHVSRWIQE